ncbi:MAG: glycoside hydrolase family 65 protein [Phycisphaerae bacterium]|nr:glycoside hydrolase family 65 protein [Phycisphaerae bacterium]
MAPQTSWLIINTRHDPHALGQHNSVFTISNGYLGIKGNLAEDRDGYSPVTLINGIYDELDMFGQIRVSSEERRYLDARHFDSAGRSPAVANLPNPLLVRVFVDNRELTLTRGTISHFNQTLNLSSGVYGYRFDHEDERGQVTRILMMRFASQRHPHRVYMRYQVTPLNYRRRVRILSGIDGRVYSNTTRERQFVVVDQTAEPAEACHLRARTLVRKHEIDMVVVNRLVEVAPVSEPEAVIEHDAVYTVYEFEEPPEAPIVLDRYVVLTSSEDARLGVDVDLEQEISGAVECELGALAEVDTMSLERAWDRADVEIEGDEVAQRYLRFCLHHILAAAPRHTDKLSVPVKLLTGEYYQGNTFYDTDTYIVPVYTLTDPEVARHCLHWRWLGLEPGRRIAKELGYEGAKFAWQAGPFGEECLGKWWRFTHTNIHINSDVSCAVMQYYWATGDRTFLHRQGADILVETSRFLASRARYDSGRDAYDIFDVAGPDEGHCESTNNFYTNYLATRNLRWAAEVLEGMRRDDPVAHAECVRRLGLAEDEPAQWLRVADRLTLLFDPATKVYEQCEGFYKLKPVPDDLLARRKVWFETVFPYQALNQPDVVMAMVLFRDDFDRDVLKANWDFYKDKSMNFSSMSFALNAIMAAEMGEMDRAYREFLICAGSDIDEELTGRKDTYAGLHGTAAGGAWMAAVFGFGGVCLSETGLRVNPRLPRPWRSMQFNLQYREHRLLFSIDPEEVRIRDLGALGPDVQLTVAGRPITLTSGKEYGVDY